MREGEADLARALLRTTHQHARDLGLQFRFRREGGGYYCTLDEGLPMMYALAVELPSLLRSVARAFRLPSASQQRARAASRLTRLLRRRVMEMAGDIHEVADMAGGTPDSIVFNPGRKRHLAPSLNALTRTLALDISGRVAKRTVIEEVHTAVEHVLRAYLGRSRRGNVARRDGPRRCRRRRNQDRTRSRACHSQRHARDAKHRGQGFDENAANERVMVAVRAIHSLLKCLREA